MNMKTMLKPGLRKLFAKTYSKMMKEPVIKHIADEYSSGMLELIVTSQPYISFNSIRFLVVK